MSVVLFVILVLTLLANVTCIITFTQKKKAVDALQRSLVEKERRLEERERSVSLRERSVALTPPGSASSNPFGDDDLPMYKR